jgi:trimeric autotransporter adhesin
MSATYTLKLTDGTTLTDVTSLESNGVGNQSTPRRVLDIDFSTSPPSFVVGDNATLRFTPGFAFTVFDSAYGGDYTVAPAGASFLDGTTKIPVNEPVNIGSYSVLGVSDTQDYWKVPSVGNDIDIFYPTSTITVTGNSLPGANIAYTVVSAVSAIQSPIVAVVPGAGGSWTINGVHTQTYDVGDSITVSGTGGGTPTGDGVYTIASKTTSATTTTLVVTGTIPPAASATGAVSATIPYTKVFVTPGSVPTGAAGSGSIATTPPSQFTFSAPPAIVVSAPNTFDITWRISGDHTARFVIGGQFNVKGNSYYSYHTFLVTAVSFSSGMTHITGRINGATTPTPDASGYLIHPTAATQNGYIQYEIVPAASSLQIMGRGAPFFNNDTTWGHAVMNNTVHMLENYADDVPPTAPLTGQLWYDQSVDQHRTLAPTTTHHAITAVSTTSFTIAGDHTAAVELQPGQKIEVYNNVGLGIENHEFTVNTVALNTGNTVITVVEPVSADADVTGVLYGRHLWNGLVTATIPTTNYVDMNDHPIINVQDIPAAHEYTVIGGDTAFDNDFQSNALNLRSANEIFVNVTGDTMTGDLTMATGVDINMTNGNINMNAASAMLFPVGSTGDIVMAGDNTLSFPVGSTGDITIDGANDVLMAGSGRVDFANNEQRMNGTSFINFPVGSTGDITLRGGNDVNFVAGSTGDVLLAGDNDVNFPVGSTGDIIVNGTNDLLFAGSGRIDLANNEQRMNGTSFINFPVGSTGDITLRGGNDVNFVAGSTGDVLLAGDNDVNFPVGSTGDIIVNGANDLLFAGSGRVNMANNEIRMNGTSFINFPVGSTGDVTLQGGNDIVFSGAGIINMGNNKITNLANATVATDALNMQTGDSRYVNVTGDAMTGALAMGTNKITGLGDATVATDALNMQTGDARYVNVTGDTMTGALTMTSANITMAGTSTMQFTGTGQVDMGTNKVVNLAAPTNGTDATNKAYVDAFVSGIVFLTPVKDPNVYNDALSAPPVSPVPYTRTYLVKPAAYTITGRTTGAGGKWIISGNHASLFANGNTFVVNGNSDGPSNATYTVASAADVSATTEITITGTVPASAGSNGTVYHSSGAWNGLDGRAVSWTGTAWVDILGRAVQSGDRFGVYMEPDNDEVPIDTSGMGAILIPAAGKVGTIQAAVTAPGFTSLGTAGAWSFYTPVEPDAVSVTGQDSQHFGHSYTFRGTYGSGTYNSAHMWIEFSGPTSVIDGAGLKFTGNTLNIGAGSGIIVGTDTISVDPTFVTTTAAPDIDINLTTKSISTTPSGWNNVTADYGIPAASTGADNISLGRAALHAADTASNNIAIGLNAMAANTYADNNIAIGSGTLRVNTNPTLSTAIGHEVLYNDVGGGENTAVGAYAMWNNTYGSTNVAVGVNALYGNTDGYDNTAVGYYASNRNTVGNDNTAIGLRSLEDSYAGSNNVAVGVAALADHGTRVTAGAFVTGMSYIITATGTTDFTLIGAANSNVGTTFVATGSGTGSGTAAPIGWVLINATNTVAGMTYMIITTGTTDFTLIGAANSVSGTVFTATGPGAGTGTVRTQAGNSVAVGYNAARYNTTHEIVAVGYGAAQTNVTGARNTAVGTRSLYTTTVGDNTAVGHEALYATTVGDGNTAIGVRALHSNTDGNDNVAVGLDTMYSNVSGYYNIAIGTESLYANVGGYESVAIGKEAMRDSTGGAENVAIGVGPLYNNTTGFENVAISSWSMEQNLTGYENVAIGSGSLQDMITGYHNVAIGNQTMRDVGGTATAGSFVVDTMYRIATLGTTDFTLIGAASNTVGVTFVATGVGAGTGTAYYVTAQNTAVGAFALQASKSANNTAIGFNALNDAVDGASNTAVGWYALSLITSGSDNTALGQSAGPTVGTYSNTTCLGANTTVTGSDQVQLGDSATTTYVYGTVQNRSDARDKADVRDTVLGLDFITALRPVDFKWDYREDYEDQVSDGSKKRNRYHHGLIAQEVKQVLDASGIDFGGYQDHAVAGGQDVLSIGYDELIAPLIKAVQELSAELETEKAGRAADFAMLLARIEQLENKE